MEPNAPPSRNRRSLYRETSGAIYVEFLIVFIPFFIMVLGMMQIALMYAAHLAVRHSAAAAARSAIVVFPDCEARYDGAPQNVVNGGGRGDDPAAIVGSVFGASGGSIPGGGGGGGGSNGGARLDAVRFAANLPMASASPSLSSLAGDLSPARQNLLGAIGGGSSALVRLAVGALGYGNLAVAVNFPERANERASTFRTRFDRRQQITARVTYLFHCGVPIVSKMACDDAPALFTGVPFRQVAQFTRALAAGRTAEELRALDVARREAQSRLRRADYNVLSRELDATASGAGLAAAYLTLSRGNFSILRAEATLPLQGHESARINRACFNASR
jgi:hypothetical protein